MLTNHRVDKPWGYEIIFANNRQLNYCGKILAIRTGESTSMHRHRVKDEVLHVVAGRFMVETLDGGESVLRELGVGQSIHMAPGQWHRLTAVCRVGDNRIVEASTFHDDADVERREWPRPAACDTAA